VIGSPTSIRLATAQGEIRRKSTGALASQLAEVKWEQMSRSLLIERHHASEALFPGR